MAGGICENYARPQPAPAWAEVPGDPFLRSDGGITSAPAKPTGGKQFGKLGSALWPPVSRVGRDSEAPGVPCVCLPEWDDTGSLGPGKYSEA